MLQCYIIARYLNFELTRTVSLLPTFPALQQLVAFQTFINAILGWLVYRIIVGPQKNQNGKGQTILSTLFAFTIALPFVILEPIYLIQLLDIRHVGLRMALLAMPIVNSLRITEGKIQTSE